MEKVLNVENLAPYDRMTLYFYTGDDFIDLNDNRLWDEAEPCDDGNNDGEYTPPGFKTEGDLIDNPGFGIEPDKLNSKLN